MTGALAVWQALLWRDLRAVLRSRSQLYSSVLFPLMVLAFLGAGVSGGLEPASEAIRGGDYASFLVPGAIVMTVLFSSTFSSASYYYDRDWGVLRVLLVSPHRPMVIFVGKALAAVVIGSLQALLVLLIASLVPPLDLAWQHGVLAGLLLTLVTVLLLSSFLAGLAQVLASRIRTMQGFHLLMNLVLFPFLFFSGAFFPLEDLPRWLQVLAVLNPLSYAVDLLRLAVYAEGGTFLGLAVDLPVLLVLGLLVPLLGASVRAQRALV